MNERLAAEAEAQAEHEAQEQQDDVERQLRADYEDRNLE